MARVAAVVIILGFKGFIQAWLAARLGDPGPKQDGRLVLNPAQHMGFWSLVSFLLFSLGWVKPLNLDARGLGLRGMIGVALGGIGACMLLAFGVGLLRPLVAGAFSTGNMGFTLVVFLNTLIDLSIWCAVLNLIPVFPLDGFTALAGFMPDRWQKAQRYTLYFEIALLVLGFSKIALVVLEPLQQVIKKLLVGT